MTGDDEEILVRVSEPCAMNSTLHTTSYPVVFSQVIRSVTLLTSPLF